MKYKAKLLSLLLLCLCCGFSAAKAQEVPALATDDTATSETQAKLAQAEQLADKFMARFAETLDFKVLQDEMFVKDERLRWYVVGHGWDEIAAPELLEQLDLATKDKFYTEYANFFWLMMAYWTLEADKDDSEKFDITKRLMEATVVPYLNVSQRTIYEFMLADFADDSSSGHESWRLKTKTELITQTEVMAVIADALRQELRRRIPEQDLRKVENGRAWDDEEEFGVAGKFEVYNVSRTAAWLVCVMRFSIIEEQGVFRIVSVEMADPT